MHWNEGKNPIISGFFYTTFIENSKWLFLVTENEQNFIHEF